MPTAIAARRSCLLKPFAAKMMRCQLEGRFTNLRDIGKYTSELQLQRPLLTSQEFARSLPLQLCDPMRPCGFLNALSALKFEMTSEKNRESLQVPAANPGSSCVDRRVLHWSHRVVLRGRKTDCTASRISSKSLESKATGELAIPPTSNPCF